ncbi:mOMP-like family protein [Simkania negevensis Z]|uniref:MOMP-like family protein n=2 Tax=Simkania negevensis TaxID=83561 RepID=F8L947_SIMNZ|nr:mOMP-like family protein [Simkania negevensis Z]
MFGGAMALWKNSTEKILTGVVCSCLMGSIQLQAVQDTSYAQNGNGKELQSVTPNVGPNTTWTVDPFFTVDFIYWTAREEGLAYAMEGANASIFNANLPTIPKGKILDPDWCFDPGFKVGAGLDMQYDGWDVYANYTWFHNSSHDSLNKPNGFLPTIPNFLFFLFNLFPTPPASFAFESAKQDWSLHFNTIDLELGRGYYISRFLTLRPHVGLKGTWQDQDIRTKYTLVEQEIFQVHQHQNSWGIGIRAGLEGCWYFIRSFGLYGDFALSGMWSGFSNTRKDNRIQNDQTRVNILDTRYLNHSVKPVIEFGLGLRYELLYHNDDFRFLIQAGWEEQIWFGYNQIIDLAEYGDRGNLSLQGFTLEVRLDF